MNEKVESKANKGKEMLKSGYAKGNDLMDKVPFLKQNPLYKKVVWGVLALVAVLLAFSIFSGPSVSDIEKETVALFHQHGAEGVTEASLKKVGKGVYIGTVTTASGDKFDVTVKHDGDTLEATGAAVALYRVAQELAEEVE